MNCDEQLTQDLCPSTCDGETLPNAQVYDCFAWTDPNEAQSNVGADESSSDSVSAAEENTDGGKTAATVALASVLVLTMLGGAYYLNARSSSYQFEKSNSADQELGWDADAERTTHDWNQEGAIAGSHYFPKAEQAGFEPTVLGSSFAQTAGSSHSAGYLDVARNLQDMQVATARLDYR